MPDTPRPGLREDKKRRTRDRARRAALTLFAQHGYRATSMEQIAAAADIAPRTLYRYFPTKETLVITDENDEPLIDAFRRQLDEHEPIDAVRRAIRATLFEEETPEDRLRRHLIETEPELQAGLVRTIITLAETYARLIADHPRHHMTYSDALTLTGAISGIALTAQRWDRRTGKLDQLTQFDAGLERLTHGFTPHPPAAPQ